MLTHTDDCLVKKVVRLERLRVYYYLVLPLDDNGRCAAPSIAHTGASILTWLEGVCQSDDDSASRRADWVTKTDTTS